MPHSVTSDDDVAGSGMFLTTNVEKFCISRKIVKLRCVLLFSFSCKVLESLAPLYKLEAIE